MKNKIEQQYISEFKEHVKGIKKDIPFLTIVPRIKQQNHIGIIFLNGLNGTKTMIAYFNHEVFLDKWLFTFDNRAQGENQNYPSRRYQKYVKDAKLSINHLINKYPEITEWYLIGESWGGGIISNLLKKTINPKIKGCYFWNMPCKIIDTNPKKGKEAFISNLKVAINYLFGISFKISNPANPTLTNNPILFRMIKIFENVPVQTGVILACWKTFKPGWNNIIKNVNQLNFKYIQSLDDVMKDEKMYMQLFNKNQNKIAIYEKGTHILSFDKDMDNQLFNDLDHFIKNNKN